MRSLQWVGLVFSLLIVGVLGGLIAPLPSEASLASTPVLTVQITKVNSDGTTTPGSTFTIPLNPVSLCTSDTTNYRYCYLFNSNAYTTTGPAARQFSIQNYLGTAQVKVGDFPNKEKMSLANVQFVPVGTATSWPNNAKVFMTITLKDKHDIQPNLTSDGITLFYPASVSIGGNYVVPSGVSAVGNEMQETSTGILDSNKGIQNIKNNYNPDPYNATTACSPVYPTAPCKGTVWNKNASGSSFGDGQVPPYPGEKNTVLNPDAAPTFGCNNRKAATGTLSRVDPVDSTKTITWKEPSCTPEFTNTIKWTLFGRATVAFSGGIDSASGGPCGDKKNPCSDLAAELTAYHKSQRDKEKFVRLQQGIPEGVPCGPDSSGVDLCNGAIKITINVTPPPPIPTTFNFLGLGPDLDDNIAITTNSEGYGEALPFKDAITGLGGTTREIWKGAFPPKDANSDYQADQGNCTSTNGTAVKGVWWDVSGGSEKLPLIINGVPFGEELLCNIHIHNEQLPKK